MSTPSLVFGGKVSQHYEDYLGAFLFESFAIDLVSKINWGGVERVLELACGSGRLTGHLAQRLPAGVTLTATDISNDMINVAKARVAHERITWQQADMMKLPFANESFDLIVCQFALMLVPDQLKALAEIYRVLKPGGKVIVSTWTELPYNKLWAIGDEVVTAAIGKSPMRANPGPFALDNAAVVLEMLQQTGFVVPQYTIVTDTGETDSAQHAAFGFIYGLPIGQSIQQQNPDILPVILQTLEDKLKTELGEQPLRAPQKALVFEAVK
jgi:ubiquinone/menaquinone biosynthesis C-methylase UbiE